MIPESESEIVLLLREIADNTGHLVASAPPKVRSWGWRLNNLIWLCVTVSGALAGAAFGYFAHKLWP